MGTSYGDFRKSAFLLSGVQHSLIRRRNASTFSSFRESPAAMGWPPNCSRRSPHFTSSSYMEYVSMERPLPLTPPAASCKDKCRLIVLFPGSFPANDPGETFVTVRKKYNQYPVVFEICTFHQTFRLFFSLLRQGFAALVEGREDLPRLSPPLSLSVSQSSFRERAAVSRRPLAFDAGTQDKPHMIGGYPAPFQPVCRDKEL